MTSFILLSAVAPLPAAEMQALLEKLIIDGRSTPGAQQENDVEVVHYPKSAAKSIQPSERTQDP